MNQKERFLKTFNYEKVDRVPDFEFGYWDETFPTWHKQGLPCDINNNLTAELFFGFEQRWGVPANVWFCPGFEGKVLQDLGDKEIIQDGEGITYERMKGSASIPKYIKFCIETREDWEKIRKERLNPDSIERHPANWADLKQGWLNRDYPLGIYCGSIYGWLRNLMGVENLSIAVATDPEWVNDMMDYLTDFYLKIITKPVTELKLDYASWWEDMCFSSGPLMSPELFEKYMVPKYKKITSFLAKHGVTINILDCDGKIDKLVPGWLESGINCMFPVESAHTDILSLRKKYGKKMLILGAVNKIALIKGKKTIDEEMNRLKPLLQDGGFIPHVDHRCPPDVTYENYLYYIQKKHELINKI
jgi:uroporphyrinogen decarboxylase